jgi:hypothetical protein
MTLNPGEEFVIARQLNDPADVSTNYVRAYIRNAKTDALITTLDLVDKGSQRFTKTWQVVSDPTGLGLYITVTTKVFTDSGYSVPSTTYGIEQHEHLIQDRINPFLSPVGPDIDYKRIRKIVAEEVSNQIIPEPKEPDLIPISEGLQALLTEIRGIDIPKAKEVDLTPVMVKLEVLQQSVNDIEIPEADFSETNSLITSKNDVLDDLANAQEEITSGLSGFKDVQTGMDKIMNEVKTIKEKITNGPVVVIGQNETKEPKKSVLDEYLNL